MSLPLSRLLPPPLDTQHTEPIEHIAEVLRPNIQIPGNSDRNPEPRLDQTSQDLVDVGVFHSHRTADFPVGVWAAYLFKCGRSFDFAAKSPQAGEESPPAEAFRRFFRSRHC